MTGYELIEMAHARYYATHPMEKRKLQHGGEVVYLGGPANLFDAIASLDHYSRIRNFIALTRDNRVVAIYEVIDNSRLIDLTDEDYAAVAAKLQTRMMLRDCDRVNKRWTEMRRGLNNCETALEPLADELTNRSQEKDGPMPIDTEALDRMGAMLEAFARLSNQMGLGPWRR